MSGPGTRGCRLSGGEFGRVHRQKVSSTHARREILACLVWQGMRTYNDNKKLAAKAAERKERLGQRSLEKKQQKRKKMRLAPAGDQAEIERRQAKFQEKKARRLARKAEQSAS